MEREALGDAAQHPACNGHHHLRCFGANIPALTWLVVYYWYNLGYLLGVGLTVPFVSGFNIPRVIVMAILTTTTICISDSFWNWTLSPTWTLRG